MHTSGIHGIMNYKIKTRRKNNETRRILRPKQLILDQIQDLMQEVEIAMSEGFRKGDKEFDQLMTAWDLMNDELKDHIEKIGRI